MRIYGAKEVTDLLGISRQRLAVLMSGTRFPQPFTKIAAGYLWDADLVDQFVRDYRPDRVALLDETGEQDEA